MRNLSSGGERVINSLARDRNKPAWCSSTFFKILECFLDFPTMCTLIYQYACKTGKNKQKSCDLIDECLVTY